MSLRPFVFIEHVSSWGPPSVPGIFKEIGASVLHPETGLVELLDLYGDVEPVSLNDFYARLNSDTKTSFQVWVPGRRGNDVAWACVSRSHNWRFIECSLSGVSNFSQGMIYSNCVLSFLRHASQGSPVGLLLDPDDYSEHHHWMELLSNQEGGQEAACRILDGSLSAPGLIGLSIALPPQAASRAVDYIIKNHPDEGIVRCDHMRTTSDYSLVAHGIGALVLGAVEAFSNQET